MQLRPDALPSHLAKGRLACCYTLSGDEPLLVIEAADAIVRAARAQGFSERTVLHADARFDWSRLAQAASGLSLFTDKTFIDLRLPSGKPGRPGADALRAHAQSATEHTLTLITLPRLDARSKKSDWAEALQAAGVWVDVASIERAQLPQWLSARLARQKQSADAQALDFMAERVEGNLLAAAQELAKLALLYPEGELTLEQVADSVLDVARYDVFKFADTVLAADSRRALKQLEGLRAEASPLPLVLWTLHEQVRNLLILQEKVNGGQNLSAAARALRLWGREALFERALRKLRSAQLVAWLDRCGQIEKLTKGLHPTALCDDPWAELARLAADIAGSLAAPTANMRRAAPAA